MLGDVHKVQRQQVDYRDPYSVFFSESLKPQRPNNSNLLSDKTVSKGKTRLEDSLEWAAEESFPNIVFLCMYIRAYRFCIKRVSIKDQRKMRCTGKLVLPNGCSNYYKQHFSARDPRYK